jgi:hypothetical protein
MLPRPTRPPGDDDRKPMQKRQQVLLTLLMRAKLVSKEDTRAERGGVVDIWRQRENRLPRTQDPAPFSWLEMSCGTRPSGTLPRSK